MPINREKYPHGSIFLGRDEKTYGKEGTGVIAYDPDYECGGPVGTPGRKCPYFELKASEKLDKIDDGGRLIHVGLASYRDPLCPKTLYYMYTKSTNPHLLRVRVIQQNDAKVDLDCLDEYCRLMSLDGKTPCPYKDNIFIHHVDAKDAKGPTFARGLLSEDIFRDYERGGVSPQDYCLSMDSHMNFEPDWDRDMVNMWNMAKNEYCVLSTYVDDAEHLGEKGITVPHLCMVTFTSSVRTHATKSCTGLTKPKLTNAVYGAGLSFSKCHAELKVPVDPHTPYVFDGEEFNRAARYWTYGYDIYTPHRVYILHNYHESQSNPNTASWHRNNDGRDFEHAVRRLNTIIDVPGGYTDKTKIMITKRGKYGLGDRRSLDELIQFSGIDLRHKRPSIDGKNRCGNLKWVEFKEHPKGVNYIPKFDDEENPMDEADATSVWYGLDGGPAEASHKDDVRQKKKNSPKKTKDDNHHNHSPFLDKKAPAPIDLSHLLPPPAEQQQQQQQQHNSFHLKQSFKEGKERLLRGWKDQSSKVAPHGVAHLPLMIQCSVVLLVLGLILAIGSSKGTGRGGDGKMRERRKIRSL